MPRLSPEKRRELIQELEERGAVAVEARPLWPDKYADPNAETACRFIFDEVRTVEEVALQPLAVPRKDYLEQLAYQWHECRETSRTLHLCKSRRLIVSWFVGALELHAMGCAPMKGAVTAKHFEGPGGARQFVWRAKAMYDNLRHSHLDWRMDPAQTKGGTSDELDSIRFPNGSNLICMNNDPEGFRGSGMGFVRVEEWSGMPYPGALLGQAVLVVQGPPDGKNGFVCTVSNAADQEEFLEAIRRS